MTPTRSTVVLIVLAFLSTPAWAEGGGDPGDAVEQVDGPKPKIISAGQDPAGGHAFLAVTPKGPRVFMGPKNDLRELDVLSMQRIKDGFMIDTLEEGEIIFETGRTQRVIQRGVPGFNSPRQTIVRGAAPDAAALDHVHGLLGGGAPKTSGVEVQVPAENAAVRFPAARDAKGGRMHGPVASAGAGAKLRARARARMGKPSRPGIRAATPKVGGRGR